MTTKTDHYTLAGWLAISLAVLLIPEIGLAIMGEIVSKTINLVVIPIHVINTIIGVFILVMFKRLLNNEFNFHKVNNLITIMIIFSILYSVIGIVGTSGKLVGMGIKFQATIAAVSLVFFVPYNIIMIVFGVQIQKMDGDMFGLLNPFAYATIASGVCGASIILLPFGLLFAMAVLVIEGMIFLRANREAEIL